MHETKVAASAASQSDIPANSEREAFNQQIRAELVRIADEIGKGHSDARGLDQTISSLQEKLDQKSRAITTGWTFAVILFVFAATIHAVAVIAVIGLALLWGHFAERGKQAIGEELNHIRGQQQAMRKEIGELIDDLEKTKRDLERPTITYKLRHLIWMRDCKTCYLCGKEIPSFDGESMHIDHVEPFSKGGTNSVENLRATHPDCNLKKRDNRHRPGSVG